MDLFLSSSRSLAAADAGLWPARPPHSFRAWRLSLVAPTNYHRDCGWGRSPRLFAVAHSGAADQRIASGLDGRVLSSPISHLRARPALGGSHSIRSCLFALADRLRTPDSQSKP